MWHGKTSGVFTLTGLIGAAGLGLLLLSSNPVRAQASDEEVVAQGNKKKFRESEREEDSGKNEKAQAELRRLRQELEQMRAELEKRAEELLKAAESVRRMQEKKGSEQAQPPQGFPKPPFGSPGGQGGFGSGFGAGFGGFGPPGGNPLEKRLKDIEAKLDRILKELHHQHHDDMHEGKGHRKHQGKGHGKHKGDEQRGQHEHQDKKGAHGSHPGHHGQHGQHGHADEAKTDACKKLPGVVDAPVRPVYYYPPVQPYYSPYAYPRPSFLPQLPQLPSMY